ncbi:heparan-alpha-glucosaminide N-acetyltransferase domain-containing protein [Acidovorax sp. PRC11]|uniref:DUF1624 domain-containing protein n=1 Tax=Acidovorax sp. PRC11 TaxID=2962592 RepID=UPI002882A609|nr:heparan-alpha-glucosaminide N-acetyltransferase domain-containing protein [Acidovorax sp. PRC11]MDT0138210.1 heparan-alpha-glucosaminide N-acetyltransferase domain-containing protein [Acidovorax sp. PRC11]
MPAPPLFSAPSAAPVASATPRLVSIDALRGLVILFMLLDHVRETFFMHHPVMDPLVLADTPTALFFNRVLAHLCAPVFIFLAGLSAFLYGSRQPDGRRAATVFLVQRGLFLVVLELTVVNFAWTFQWPPQVVYLQVIWVIGLSMLALALLLWLPRGVLVVVGLLLVAGHNLLDGVHFPAGHVLHVPWAILHDRGWLAVGEGLRMRTSYPLLPWIGVIALGYAAGPWFTSGADVGQRRRRLMAWSAGALVLFVLLRWLNVYGDRPWAAGATPLETVMGFLNVTKYPPSLLFVALTLGIGLALLAAFERVPARAGWLRVLLVFGAAPMFFYVLHLYVLRVLYIGSAAFWGLNQGRYFGFDAVWQVWLGTAVLAALLYGPVRAFGAFKARRKDLAWLRFL